MQNTDTTISPPEEQALLAAREVGRLDGEAYNTRLDVLEAREREKRLTELAWSPRAESQMWGSHEASYRVLELEARVEALGSYVRAVQSSAPWRFIQWLRSLVGREW
ncbi:MAG: hypothetical protein HC897_10820 [Thermoanaerobaculia bacterium]|nr:hypothetical protein [Thermoanaerobaculia bacterium]